MNRTIAARRLVNQAIHGTARRTAADAVTWLGAVQSQEYGPATWALALRTRSVALDSDVDRAFETGRILRTHVMRPTWHFVTPADIRWMLDLTAPRVHSRMAPYNRRLELDAATLTRAVAVCERALGGGRCLTRLELGEQLAAAGIRAAGQRLAHIALHAELERVICSGPRRGRQFTYALLATRAPHARRLSRDEALGELSRRFFRSHGPATVRDFVWWSGLTTADARRGLDIVNARSETENGFTYWTVHEPREAGARTAMVHLLPVYDEYLVAYRDRDAVPHWPPGARTLNGRARGFQHALVVNGHVAGLWRTVRTTRGATVEVVAARPLGRAEREALHQAAARYGACIGAPVSIAIR